MIVRSYSTWVRFKRTCLQLVDLTAVDMLIVKLYLGLILPLEYTRFYDSRSSVPKRPVVSNDHVLNIQQGNIAIEYGTSITPGAKKCADLFIIKQFIGRKTLADKRKRKIFRNLRNVDHSIQFTSSEVINIMKHAKCSKPPGPDGISMVMPKNLDHPAIEFPFSL